MTYDFFAERDSSNNSCLFYLVALKKIIYVKQTSLLQTNDNKEIFVSLI